MTMGKDTQGLKRVDRQETIHKGRTQNPGWRRLEVSRLYTGGKGQRERGRFL